ncbi:hypothetical protein MTBPR1_180015 [Candidatus Terasakiella magnetica]|uniref:Liposome tubulation protein MamY C-terminal domain-containing protein n=1 Tax=Candidatus Terasakiella magnetica TaxID=1867952 RepID=A0A1C3RFW2_9PROT|nr:hypothetical protein [Candidatus Terasakiella magnetica]SCA56102.1 hypothetical protein MTBPR1_180015 [Candidatus Terasakiella magnetica]
MIKELLQGKAFQLGVLIPSIAWLVIWTSYISIYMGWGNFFYLLPHEVAGVLLAFIFPVFLLFVSFVGLSFYGTVAGHNAQILEKIEAQEKKQSEEIHSLLSKQNADTEMLSAVTELLGKISKSSAANQQALVENGEMHRAFASALNNHHADLGSIEHKLSMLVQMETEREERTKRLDEEAANDPLKAISQQTSLLGMFDIIVNDTSVSATRLLVNLLEANGHPKTEALQLVQGLMSAYSVGEKNVFLTVLSQQLTASPKGTKPLAELGAKSDVLRGDIAKVMKASKDIETALERCKEEDLGKMVFDNKPLKTLAAQLGKDFFEDGSAKEQVRPKTASPFKA